MIKKDSNWNKIAVALVNYNNRDVIGKCIDSIYANTTEATEILVVDNGSIDDSMEIIERDYPEVHTIYAGENTGWGAGCNVGFKESFARGSEYVLLLNTDTEIENNMIETLLKYADEKTITIPRMYYDKEDKDNSLWYSGGSVNFDAATTDQTIFDSNHNDNEEVTFATGCCALIHKSVYETIGGFDEEYFLYYEDVDYSLTAINAGIKLLYVPSAALWHKVGGSSGGGLGYAPQYYTIRNRLYFADKYKNMMHVSVSEILRQIYEDRGYFNLSVFYELRDICQAAIKDYLNGIRGKEKNYIHDGYTMLNGFYEREFLGGGLIQQCCGSKVAEIEITNREKTGRLMSFTASYINAGSEEHREIRVYWDNQLRYTIFTPANNFTIQERMGSNQRVRIRFETSEPRADRLMDRRNSFAIINPVLEGMGGVELTSGVFSSEKDLHDVFHWALSPEMGILVENELNEARKYVLAFELREAPGRDYLNAVLIGEGIEQTLHPGMNQIEIDLDALEKKEVFVKCSDEPVSDFCGDVRTFYFRIQKFRLSLV